MINVQKHDKEIGKIIHVSSGVQLNFYEAARILLVRKENKNNDFIQQFVSFVAPFWRVSTERMLLCVSCATRISCFHSNQSVNKRIRVVWLTQNRIYCLRSVDNLQNGATVNKVVIFVFFSYKKYSLSFVKLQLNPWWHMDYFTDLLSCYSRIQPCDDQANQISPLCWSNVLFNWNGPSLESVGEITTWMIRETH